METLGPIENKPVGSKAIKARKQHGPGRKPAARHRFKQRRRKGK